MFTDLREINRIILATKQRSNNDNLVTITDIVDECRRTVIGGKIPNHIETINFCTKLNILRLKDGYIKLTELGNDLLEKNPQNSYDIQINQQDLIVNNCFLDGFFKKQTISLLKNFIEDTKTQTFALSLNEGIVSIDPIFLFLLKQSGLVSEKKNMLYINPKYTENVAILRVSHYFLTEEKFEKQQKEKKIVGKIGEEIVLQFEKNRLLKDHMAKPESSLVKIISTTRLDAGYDIESFDKNNKELKFDRFIEVKGSRSTKFDIYLSANEFKKANELRQKYWIYFISDIDIEKQTGSQHPITIQDPFTNIFQNSKYNIELLTNYHITENL